VRLKTSTFCQQKRDFPCSKFSTLRSAERESVFAVQKFLKHAKSETVVKPRRHVVGLPNVNREWGKMHIPETFFSYFADRVPQRSSFTLNSGQMSVVLYFASKTVSYFIKG